MTEARAHLGAGAQCCLYHWRNLSIQHAMILAACDTFGGLYVVQVLNSLWHRRKDFDHILIETTGESLSPTGHVSCSF